MRARTLLFLRHPIERALSTYNFWTNLPDPEESDDSPEAQLLRAAKGVTLEEFVHSQDSLWWGAISNQATWLVGHAYPWDLDAPFDIATVKLAQHRIQTVDMLGLTERVDESMPLIASQLDIPYTRPLPAVNATPLNRESSRVAPSIVRALTDANEYDLALWEDANREFEKRLKSFKRNASSSAPSHPRISPRHQVRAVLNTWRLNPGVDPIIGEGWLPQEESEELSWRYATSLGPAYLYVHWPIENDECALVIDSPFSGENFDYDSIRIFIDENPVHCRCEKKDGLTILVTHRIPRAQNAVRKIAFSYDDPQAGVPIEKRKTHAEQIAFAVSAIRWTKLP
jgi:hypothetical protein